MQDTDILTGPALAFLLVVLFAIFCVKRMIVVVPVLVATTLMTIGQEIEIGPLHFYFLRIVIIAAWVRVWIRREIPRFTFNPVDKAFLWWAVVSILIAFIPKDINPNSVMPKPTFMSTFISKGGFALDSLGAYFLIRCLVRDLREIVYAAKVLIIISIVLAYFMTFEKFTGRNLFSVFGAVPEVTIVRDGHLRCQGPFTHPIHAGNYGSTLMPLCIGLWYFGMKRVAAMGFVGATIVTIESSSSGPLMAWIYGIAAFCCWPLNDRMKLVRRTLLALVIAAQLFMKSPVWWTIARVGDVVGGGGYWRSKLIDQFVNHFREWWLIGTNYTAHWSPTGGLPLDPDNMDLTNQFVAEGVHGGIIELILFVVVIVKCFQRIGLAIHSPYLKDEKHKYIFWSLGCCLVAYMTAFLAVAGSMQTDILYFTLLAFIAGSPVTKEEYSSVSMEDSTLVDDEILTADIAS